MPSLQMRQVTNVLVAALEKPAHERDGFVRAECGDDQILAAEVLGLLSHHEQATTSGFLTVPAGSAETFVDRDWFSEQLAQQEAALEISAEQLLERIAAQGLSPADEIARWWHQQPEQDRPTAGIDLAVELVRQQKLTAYQAAVLLERLDEPLTLGNYEILDSIAEGGMGHVYKARHRVMNRVVAVKLISQAAIDSPAAARRFRREVETAAKLNHLNVVQAFDAAEDGGIHILVMEHVDGIDLGHMVSRTGPLPLAQALEYTLQAARGLAYAHQNHVVHRDVKPSNMLVDQEDTLKILDLGLARIDQAESLSGSTTNEDLTREGHFFGTLNYLAPEQATSAKTADHRADIYALGCTLHYLLTARPIYQADSPAGKIVAHREEPIPSLAELREEVPEQLDELFAEMVGKDREERPQSMEEIAQRLEGIIAGLPAEDPPADWDLPSTIDAPLPVPASPDSQTTATFESAGTDPKLVPPPVDSLLLRRQQSKPWWLNRWPQIAAAVCLLAFGALAAVLITIRTPEGVLTVILQEGFTTEDVTVQVDGQSVTVTPSDDGKAFTLDVEPGTRKIRVTTQDGMHFYSTRFEIARDGRKILRAKFIPPLPSGGDREIAEWLLGMGASLGIRVSGAADRHVTNTEELPDEEFYVFAVNLESQEKFDNEALANLCDLEHLESIELYAVPINDGAMELFAKMSNLESLHLRGVALDGAGLDKLQRLEHLKYLTLWQVPIKPMYLTGLRTFDSLKTLLIRDSRFADADLNNISGLKSLDSLILHENLITGEAWHINDLYALTNLEIISTGFNDDGLASIVHTLPQLRTLKLANTRITDSGLQHLVGLNNIDHLVLNDNPQLTDKGMTHLAKLNSLTNIELRNVGLTDAGLASLTSLRDLESVDISDTRVTDRGLEVLREFSKLSYVKVAQSDITRSGLERFRKEFTNIQVISESQESSRVVGQPMPLPMLPDSTDPVSRLALVTRPTKIDGLKSWSIETIASRGTVPGFGNSTAMSPDDKHFAVAYSDGSVRFYDVTSGEMVQVLPAHQREVFAVGWSTDNKYLATIGMDDRARIWSWPELTLVDEVFDRYSSSWPCLTWAPDRALVALGGPTLQFWAPDGQLPSSRKPRIVGANALDWSSDGRHLAIASGRDVLHWNIASGEVFAEFAPEADENGEFEDVDYLAWSPNGELVAGGKQGRRAWLWNAKNGTLYKDLGAFTGGLAWSSDSKTLLKGTRDAQDGNAVIHVSELQALNNPMNSLFLQGQMHARGVQWSRDGNTIIGVDDNGRITFFETPSYELQNQIAPIKGNFIQWMPDSSDIAWNNKPRPDDWGNHYVHRWSFSEGEIWRTDEEAANSEAWASADLLATYNGHEARIFERGQVGPRTRVSANIVQLCWSPEKDVLAIATENEVVTWNPLNGAYKEIGSVDEKHITCLAWSNNNTIAVATRERDLYAWANGESSTWTTTDDTTIHPEIITFSPDGDHVAIAFNGSNDAAVIHTSSGTRERLLSGNGTPHQFVWSRDSKRLYCNYWDRVLCWDIGSSGLVPVVDKQSAMQYQGNMFLAPDALRYIVADGAWARLFDFNSNQPVRTYAALREGRMMQIAPSGHYMASNDVTDEIVYIAVTDDGQHLTFTPKEFEEEYGWKNDPEQAKWRVEAAESD